MYDAIYGRPPDQEFLLSNTAVFLMEKVQMNSNALSLLIEIKCHLKWFDFLHGLDFGDRTVRCCLRFDIARVRDPLFCFQFNHFGML